MLRGRPLSALSWSPSACSCSGTSIRRRSDRPLPRTLDPRASLGSGPGPHCSPCLMSMMAAWCAAVGPPSCATAFIAARTAFNMRADHVGGVARRLDIGPVLRRDLLAVVPHHGREFDHFLAQLAAYLLGTFPDRRDQCLTLSDHLLRRFIALVHETERDLDGFIAAGCDLLVERSTALPPPFFPCLSFIRSSPLF